MHARTTKELYSGEPHFNLLKDYGKKMKVPLIISGNIFTLDDAINALKITKASAVMVARGGIGNPRLITQIDKYLSKSEKIDNISQLENIKYCRELSKALILEKGERTAVSILRSIAPKFFFGIKNSKKIRCEISQNIKSYQDLDNILKRVTKELKYGK